MKKNDTECTFCLCFKPDPAPVLILLAITFLRRSPLLKASDTALVPLKCASDLYIPLTNTACQPLPRFHA